MFFGRHTNAWTCVWNVQKVRRWQCAIVCLFICYSSTSSDTYKWTTTMRWSSIGGRISMLLKPLKIFIKQLNPPMHFYLRNGFCKQFYFIFNMFLTVFPAVFFRQSYSQFISARDVFNLFIWLLIYFLIINLFIFSVSSQRKQFTKLTQNRKRRKQMRMFVLTILFIFNLFLFIALFSFPDLITHKQNRPTKRNMSLWKTSGFNNYDY